MADTLLVPTISLAAAERAVRAAVERATELGVAVVVAVADAAGELKAYARMDGAPLLSVRIAQDKAWTAAAFGLPTDAWWGLVKDEPPLLHGIVKTDRLIIFAGGLPLVVEGRVVGGIGV
ncbi:MAG TPA: heme-binding protein, partial [Candidatus Binatia bacterium]|nr:heme-binding protein [Candidatus Binatia bacterium]